VTSGSNWLRLPSGDWLNMALVAAIKPAPADDEGAVVDVYSVTLVTRYHGADAETVLAWKPRKEDIRGVL
jgi:hypothetical protein